MAWFKRKLIKKEITNAPWRMRWMGEVNEKRSWVTTGQILYALGFLLFAGIVAFVTFAGQWAVSLQAVPGQIAKARVISQFPFSYESKTQRKKLIEERCQKIAPCYKLDLEPYQDFRSRMLAFGQGLNNWEKSTTLETPTERSEQLEQFIHSFNQQNHLSIQPEDVQALMGLDPEMRLQVIEEGLLYLKEILSTGVLDTYSLSTPSGQPVFFSVHIEGNRGTTSVQSPEEAMLSFRRYLRVLEIDSATGNALFRILKAGIQPNLIYDSNQSTAQFHQIAASIAPVVEHVETGTILLEPGTLVTPEQYERLSAYRHELKLREATSYGFSSSLIENLILTFILLLAAVVYIRLSLPGLHQSSRKLALCGLVLIFNLALIRLLFFLGDFFFLHDAQGFGAVLPFLAPVALGPMMVAIMLDGGSAILIAIILSALTTLMQSRGLDLCILYLISSFVGTSIARGSRLRTRVVRAGAIAGFITALGAIAIGIDDLPFQILLGQAGIAIITGAATGIIVIGLLPLLEHLFKITTDITLLELTDFNHPLLRRLQLIAPGTYHHSLMVANLAERAAVAINANSLACRAAALFHDIGKMVKPEYFIENQQEGLNPHQGRSPSMSALVIKHHVKEGVEIAREHKLPRVIIDIIEQHHGTTLIQYFYVKALKQIKKPNEINEETNTYNSATTVDETTFRYDGPKPMFKESAIIFFADTIEAASRSLKKVTLQNIDDLVERIFDDRLADHQLDNCPLTFKELSELKKSFSFTLMNMFHARIEYPHAKEPSQAG